MDAKYCISDYIDKFHVKLMKIREKYGVKNIDGNILLPGKKFQSGINNFTTDLFGAKNINQNNIDYMKKLILFNKISIQYQNKYLYYYYNSINKNNNNNIPKQSLPQIITTNQKRPKR
jgi:hypothetical protein